MSPGSAGHSGPPKVELLGPGDPAWDDHLVVAKRDIYHLAGYHAYAEGSGEGEPILVVVGDRRRGLAWPYLLRRIDAIGGLSGTDATDVTSVYGYPGPIAWGCQQGDPFVTEAWRRILEVWREQRVVSAFTRFHPLLGNAALAADLPPPADSSGIQPAQPLVPVGPTVSIDCRLDHGAARQGYAKVLRQEIAAARRAGLATEVDEDWSEIETFTRLYGETMERCGAGAEYTLALAGHHRRGVPVHRTGRQRSSPSGWDEQESATSVAAQGAAGRRPLVGSGPGRSRAASRGRTGGEGGLAVRLQGALFATPPCVPHRSVDPGAAALPRTGRGALARGRDLRPDGRRVLPGLSSSAGIHGRRVEPGRLEVRA
jgi:hypothetical protein